MDRKLSYEELERRIEELEAECRRAASESISDEIRYRTLFETALDSIFILENFRFVECNRMTLKIFGCEKPDDILGRHPWDFSPPRQPDGSDSKEKAIAVINTALNGAPQRFYWRHIRKDGQEFDAEISISRFEQATTGAALAIVRDITHLKQVEADLRESVEKYKILFDLESDAIALIEIDTGNMLEVNQSFVDLYGYSREEILKMKNIDFSAEPERTRQATQQRGSYIPVRYHKKKDGTVFPTEITATILKYQGKDAHIAAIRDITERKRLEDQLQRSQRMESLGLLAGGVAHDLNNVLSGIINYPELLLMNLPKESKLRGPIEKMQQTGYRAAAIVEDLLTIARGVATNKEPLDINQIINDYLNSPECAKLRFYNPDAKIRTRLDTGLFKIKASPIHIRKVIMNLVANAAEAIEGSGTITISTMNRYLDEPLKGYNDVAVDEYVVVNISDDGSGISAEDLARIFEPFFTKKTLGRSGTGLGLSVVWNVVQEHKGYIDVKSNQEGTTFELYFPITREALLASPESLPFEQYKGNGEKILVVDDVESQREITCSILDTLGYAFHAVSSGEEAVEYVKSHEVDLILLDMIMAPGLNGLETYRRIIQFRPNQKAIIISGFTKTDEVIEAQQLGAGALIQKPFKLETIGVAIRDELKRKIH